MGSYSVGGSSSSGSQVAALSNSAAAPAVVTPNVVEQSVRAVSDPPAAVIPPQTKHARHLAGGTDFKLPGVSVQVFIRSLESFEAKILVWTV